VKKCVKCGKVQPYSEFYWAKGTADERACRCKSCTSAHQKAYRIANPEKYKTPVSYRRTDPEMDMKRQAAYLNFAMSKPMNEVEVA
jgi:hypothetical protein